MKQVLLPLMRISIGIFTFAYLHFSSEIANAQVTADDSVNTQVTKTGDVSEITGGETKGDNLFHSFREFSVETGKTAAFLNSNDIANIFSRVTGGDISRIDGLIKAKGSANLFLINPAGIIFGEGASLNIGGSFYGSTADSILFKDGEFSATDLENPPVLTINAPIGLSFRDNPQDIINQSGALDNSTEQFVSGLQVLEGKNLALIGGDVRFDGGYVFAPGGKVELGGLSAAGTISFNDDGSFSFPEGIVRGDVFLNQGSLVAVNGSEGGNLTVNTNNLEISGNSTLLGGTAAGTGIANGQSGDIVIDATGKIAIDTSIINNVVQAGNGGDIQITANSLSLDNSVIDNSTEGIGNAGNLEIKASDSVNLSGDGILINTTVKQGATGKGGNATINAETLTLTDGAQISASTFGSGDGGSLSITANKELSLNGRLTAIGSQVETGAVGDAGDVAINTSNLTLADGAFLSTATFSEGDAGRLDITADSITVNASKISAEVRVGLTDNNESTQAIGKGGSININTETLNITNGGQISIATFGKGDAGNLEINALKSVNLSGAGILIDATVGSTSTEDGTLILATGDGGNVNFNTKTLSLTNGAQISSSTFGAGNAGNITVNASDTVSFKGTDSQGKPSAIFSNVDAGGEGDGGEIKITAGSLSLLNGGQLNAFVRAESETASGGNGDAGKVTLDIRNDTTIAGVNEKGTRSGIFSDVETGATGNAGGIELTTGNLAVTDGARLSSSTLGTGDAGNITVNASDTVSFKGTDSQGNPSAAFSNVEAGGKGKGGEIKITAGSLSLLNGGQLNTFVRQESETASGGNGDAGKVTLDIRDDTTIAGVNEKGTRSGIFSDVETGATGNAGGIDITTGNLAVTDGARLSSSTFGAGNAGGIELTTGNLAVTDGAQLFSSTLGAGNAGNITVNASDTVSFKGTDSQGNPSAAFSNVEAGGKGKGGEIKITAGSLSLLNGGQLNAFVRAESETASGGNGDAGKVTLDIRNDTTIAGVEKGTSSGIFSIVETGATGNAGGIDITTGNLAVTDGARLSSSTLGTGNAGNITINANDTVSFKGTDSLGKPSAVFSNVEAGGVGIAGNINIKANSISLTNGAQLQSGIVQNLDDFTKSGLGIGGNIKLNAEEDITLSGRNQDGISSGILTGVEEQVIFGNAGNIELDADLLALTDGAQLNTRFSGLLGNAGNITVKADSLTLDDNSSITSSSIPSKAFPEDFKKAVLEAIPADFPEFSPEALKGGNVTISLQDVLKLSGGSVVNAQATGKSNGGNITINAPDGFIVAFPNQNNDITATAEQGAGGKINIAAESVLGIEERELNDRTNDINAKSDVLGLDGTVNLNTSDINPLQGSTELPSNVVEVRQINEQTCSVDRDTGEANGLTVTGRGGVQPSPDLPLSSQTIMNNGKNAATEINETQVKAIASVHTSQGDIIPAQGVVVTKDGRIILTAYPTDGNSRLPQGSANCTK